MNSQSKRFDIGDLAYFGSKLVIICNVRGVLGFHLYTVMDLDNGETMEVGGASLLQATAAPLNSDEVSEVQKEKRFNEPTDEELDEIEENATSDKTKKSTRWGVRVLKGK